MTLTGDNGILKRATEAQEKTEEAKEIELIKLAISEAQIGENGYQELDANNLQKAIDNQFNGRDIVVSDNGDGTFTVSCLDTLKEYIVSSNNVESGVNYNEYFDKATAQVVDGKTIYAIDKNGNNVNMNNWEFCYDTQTNGYALNDKEVLNNSEYGGTSETRVRNEGYKGGYNEETGEITENVPMFIKEENEEWKPVTSMYNTFYGCTNLKKAPEIPNTVKCMWSTYQSCSNLTEGKVGNGVTNLWNCFMDCANLVTSPHLPNSVENMMQTFYNCTKLETILNIPKGVINMNGTFSYCSNLERIPSLPEGVIDLVGTFSYCNSLKKIPNIPDTVKNMYGTFQHCSNLIVVPQIGKSVENMDSTFYLCTSLQKAPEIPEKVKIMRSTFSGCTNLTTPPSKIPSSVINMISAFSNCSKLEGNIEINANLTNEEATSTDNNLIVGKKSYNKCFVSAATSGNGLIITTKNSNLESNDYMILKDIINTKSASSNISM